MGKYILFLQVVMSLIPSVQLELLIILLFRRLVVRLTGLARMLTVIIMEEEWVTYVLPARALLQSVVPVRLRIMVVIQEQVVELPAIRRLYTNGIVMVLVAMFLAQNSNRKNQYLRKIK